MKAWYLYLGLFICILGMQVGLNYITHKPINAKMDTNTSPANFFIHFYSEYDQHISDEKECIYLHDHHILDKSSLTHVYRDNPCQRFQPWILKLLSWFHQHSHVHNVFFNGILPSITTWLMMIPNLPDHTDLTDRQQLLNGLHLNVYSLIYLLLPMTWLLSDSSKLRHFCFMLLTHDYILCHKLFSFFIVPLGFLIVISMNPEYLLFLPIIIAVVILSDQSPINKQESKRGYNSFSSLNVVTCVSSGILTLFAIIYGQHHVDIMSKVVDRFSLRGDEFSPNVGIGWYLHALVLPGYETYFEWLLILQPTLCMIVALMVLSSCNRPLSGLILKLLFMMMNIFVIQPSIVDICLILLAFQQYDKVINQMRYLSYIRLGIVFSMSISYVMAYLWIVLSTGNANFLFFQGICFCVFVGLFAMEMINTLTRGYWEQG